VLGQLPAQQLVEQVEVLGQFPVQKLVEQVGVLDQQLAQHVRMQFKLPNRPQL
jgi:hypothetical protein